MMNNYIMHLGAKVLKLLGRCEKIEEPRFRTNSLFEKDSGDQTMKFK